ncbi:MAG: hypothetical protein FJY11_09205 [Bacteroidetes bacterium]|nr:hypothetical protein [Bacteroidota bacterium]
MTRILSAVITLFTTLTLFPQQSVDWGVSAGVTGYLGDINPDRLFVSPGAGASLFYRYNIHPRHSLRSSFMAASLSGSDQLSGNAFQEGRGESFSGYIGEMSALFEFNFFPYATTAKRWTYTPFLAGGFGICFIATDVFTYTPVLPVSVGFKITPHKNFGLEAEYGFRKTFYDNFDGLVDQVDPEHRLWTHNNDWYTFAGLTLTWKMFNRLTGCPAYEEIKVYNKRR